MPISFFFVVLFLAVMGFLPVLFRLRLTYDPPRCEIDLEMSLFFGLLKTSRIYRREGEVREDRAAGRFEDALRWLEGFPSRFRRYGFGGTLLASFVPPRYLRWLRVAEELERQGRMERFRWQTVLGTKDAATTALGVGTLWAVKGGVLAFLRWRYHLAPEKAAVAVIPSFLQPRFFTRLECIFTWRVGQIMRATLAAFLREKLGKGRG